MTARRWQKRALCAFYGDLPWLADAEQVTAFQAHIMRGVCGRCPVRWQCEAQVVEGSEVVGWWAGRDRGPGALPAVSSEVWGQVALDLSGLNEPSGGVR